MAYIGREPVIGNFVKLDAITVVNGQAAYTMNNGGSAFTAYDNVNQFLVSLNGILQSPTDSFTVSGSTLTFASNLSTGDVIDFVIVLGNSLDIGTPSDNTVTAAKLNDDIISGSTELASEPADTDEFLVSDAGTLKRIDYSLIKGGGITETDQWRVTADSTSGSTDITANWERNDSTGFGYLGTGMSQSSGIFTFPSTGIYLVRFILNRLGGSSFLASYSRIYVTTNNSSYTEVSRGEAQGGAGEAQVLPCETLVDVTDTSNVKVKFALYGGDSSGTMKGDSSMNKTYATFIRLGDT